MLDVEWQNARGERGKKSARILDLHQPSGSRVRGGESRGERTGGEAESRLATDRLQQPAPHLSNRVPWSDHAFEVEPRDAFVTHLDSRREVVERGGDELA